MSRRLGEEEEEEKKEVVVLGQSSQPAGRREALKLREVKELTRAHTARGPRSLTLCLPAAACREEEAREAPVRTAHSQSLVLGRRGEGTRLKDTTVGSASLVGLA